MFINIHFLLSLNPVISHRVLYIIQLQYDYNHFFLQELNINFEELFQ